MTIEVVQSLEEAIQDPAAEAELPGTLPVLPLKETVAFPNSMTPLAVGQERSVQLVNDALSRDRMLVMVASKDSEIEQPGPDDLYRVGVAGTIARMLRMPDGTLRILVQGGPRVRLDEFVSEQPYLVGEHPRGARRRWSCPPSSRRSRVTSRPLSRRSSRAFPTSPRSCRSRSPTSTTPRRSGT